MKKNPILVFTGLAIAAVAGVVGLTRDRWMPPAAVEVTTGDASQTAPATAEQQAAPAAPEAAPAAEQSTAKDQAAAPASESPATDEPVAAPAAEAPPAAEQSAAPTAETPANAEQAAAPEAAAPEAQQAAAQPPASEPEAAATPSVEPQPAAESQQAAAPAVEQSAVDQPAPQQPATQEAPADDTVPTFDTVRVEKSGEAVIAGQAEAGAEVAVKLDGKTIGTTTANSDGSFVVVPEEPLPAGSGALTIETKTDANAPATQSEQTVAIIVPEQGKEDALVAVMSPDAPTKVLQKPEPEPEPAAAAETEVAAATPAVESGADENSAPAAKPRMVSLDAVDYDAEGNIVFSGRGTPGQIARIYVDNALTGEAVIGTDGRWTFSGTTAVAPGVHSLRVDSIDGAGKVASRIEVPFFREETTKVATATPDQVVPKSDAGDAEPGAAASDATAAAAEAPPAAEQAAMPTEGRLVIQPGNNLWRISKVIYGDGLKYATLYQANKDQIRDPDLIYPGQVFRTPDVLPPETIDPTLRDPLTATESSAVVQ